MNLVSLLLSTFFAMECLGVSISYIERKSWIRSFRHRRSSSSSDCPDCLSQEEGERPTNCALEREERRRIAKLTRSTEYIPICRKDGSYASVQCHPSTRSCWCVTESGRPISGSSVLSTGSTTSKPNCAKYHRRAKSATKRRSSQAKKNRKFCNHADRSRFNVELIKTFRSEYNRHMSISAPRTISDSDTITDEIVLSWKFDHLDRNIDSVLQRNETSILKSLVKQQIQPRQCAKTFITFCAKSDKKITRKEWLECLRTSSIDSLPFDTFNSLVDSGSSRGMHPSQLLRPAGSLSTGGSEHAQPPLSPKGSETVEVSNCLTDRQSALASQKQNESIIVPECNPTGSYKKIQCAQGKAYCWCVEEDTGVKISTVVFNSIPDCDKKNKPMRGCTGPKKQKFLTDLMDILTKRMTSKGDNKRLQVDNRNGTKEEQVARWYFEQLDENHNGLLDRKEWKTLRNETMADKKLKRCGKKLPRHCDVNQDKKITQSEWLDCLGANKSSETTTSKIPVRFSNGPRSGKNPFTTILS